MVAHSATTGKSTSTRQAETILSAMRKAPQQTQEGDSSMADTDWLAEAKTAYERGNATAATAAALIDIANTLRIQKGGD
jgi:hypothetical protein